MKENVNRLVLLPKVNGETSKVELIDLLNEFKLNNDDKINTIADILINKITLDELAVSEYFELRKELLKDEDKKLDRIIDSYIYVLNNDKEELQNKTQYFIVKNNLPILQERIVLMKYKSYKATRYTTYNRNMTYLELFNFIRNIDSKYSSFIRRMSDNLDSNELENYISNDSFYENVFDLLEKEFSFYQESEIGKILYDKYKEGIYDHLKFLINQRIRLEKNNATDEYRDYVRSVKTKRDTAVIKKKMNGRSLRNYNYISMN